MNPQMDYEVSGNVTESVTFGSVSGANVTLTLFGDTTPTGSDSTDSNGAYSIQNIPDGNYVLTVMAPGYAPYSEIVVISGGDEVVDVLLDPSNPGGPFNINGRVIDSDTNSGISGATVILSDGSTSSTDGNGDYTFVVNEDGVYVVAAAMVGYEPNADSVTVSRGRCDCA